MHLFPWNDASGTWWPCCLSFWSPVQEFSIPHHRHQERKNTNNRAQLWFTAWSEKAKNWFIVCPMQQALLACPPDCGITLHPIIPIYSYFSLLSYSISHFPLFVAPYRQIISSEVNTNSVPDSAQKHNYAYSVWSLQMPTCQPQGNMIITPVSWAWELHTQIKGKGSEY